MEWVCIGFIIKGEFGKKPNEKVPFQLLLLNFVDYEEVDVKR
jgi:hypothetical protein